MLCQKGHASVTVQMTQEETTLGKHRESCKAEHSEVKQSLNSGYLCPSRIFCVQAHADMGELPALVCQDPSWSWR